VSAEGTIVAADGMPVRPLASGEAGLMGAAIGYLAPGARYAVHFHGALEQLTFVIAGTVDVTMLLPGAVQPTITRLTRGEALTNPPLATLDFANPGPEAAEVLFVCAPPFPIDGSDVALAETHRPLTAAEWDGAADRASWAMGVFRQKIAARLAIRPRG